MKQWYPYWEWEDFAAGMYVQVSPADMLKCSATAAESMVQVEAWGAQMAHVIAYWPISASQNLLCISGNGRAWVGAAAMCLWQGQPACVTRNAWWRLTEEQQKSANALADAVIKAFRSQHAA